MTDLQDALDDYDEAQVDSGVDYDIRGQSSTSHSRSRPKETPMSECEHLEGLRPEDEREFYERSNCERCDDSGWYTVSAAEFERKHDVTTDLSPDQMMSFPCDHALTQGDTDGR